MNAPFARLAPLRASSLRRAIPILGVTEAFNADPNPRKVNLGVGVYCDENGKVPLLECVKRAERELTDWPRRARYLPIDGIPAYDREVRRCCSAAIRDVIATGRAVTVQAVGGTGALKVGADFLRRFAPGAQVWISDPSWENHRALFEGAGFTVNTYAYYDAATRGLDFAGMLAALEQMPAGSDRRAARVLPQSDGGRPDARAMAARSSTSCARAAWCRFSTSPTRVSATASMRTAASCAPLPPRPARCSSSSSFSKSFSIYGERVGALSVVAADKDEAARVLSQVKRTIRANYSNPPTHGGQIVATVLCSPELRALWEAELAAMRDRIKLMRALAGRAAARARARARTSASSSPSAACSPIPASPRRRCSALRDEFSIYAIDTGRICVAALNSRNVESCASPTRSRQRSVALRRAARRARFDSRAISAIIQGYPTRE